MSIDRNKEKIKDLTTRLKNNSPPRDQWSMKEGVAKKISKICGNSNFNINWEKFIDALGNRPSGFNALEWLHNSYKSSGGTDAKWKEFSKWYWNQAAEIRITIHKKQIAEKKLEFLCYCNKIDRDFADREDQNEFIGFNKSYECDFENAPDKLWDEFGEYIKSIEKWNDVDRIVFAHQFLDNHNLRGKYIILIPLSVNLLFGNIGTPEERNILNGKTRNQFAQFFLEKYQPGIILWDEFHRYHKKVKGVNSFTSWEINSHLSITRQRLGNCRAIKALFISATPYQTNISGKENKALDGLYSFDDEEKIEPLPSFEEFAEIYCSRAYTNTEGVWTHDIETSKSVLKKML